MKVLKSFEDKEGVVSYAHIKKYNANPLDVMEQFKNGAKHMFRGVGTTDGIPDAVDKLQHNSGIVITKEGDITGEFIGDFDMGDFDRRISNLNEDCQLDTYDVEPHALNIGDVIIDMTNYTVTTYNG